MGSMRLRLRSAAWLALVALLALALMPTIARALAFAHGDASWAEVCTTQGLRLTAVAQTGDEAPAAGRGHLDHCAFCALSAGAAPLPSTAAAVLPLSPQTVAPPPLFLHAPRTLFAWGSAQPRAPPHHG